MSGFLIGTDVVDMVSQVDSGDASTVAFTLDNASTTNGTNVYISGVRQVPTTDYSVSGTTITFSSAPPTGTSNILYTYTKPSVVNVPADASVTAVKVGAGAVTSAKIDSTVASTNGTNTFTKTQSGSITALTSSSASIAVDLALNNHYSHTFTENTTLANPTNIVAGTSGSIFLTQHASAAKTLAFGAYWKFPAQTAPTITATAAVTDRIDYIVRSTTLIDAVWTGDVG